MIAKMHSTAFAWLSIVTACTLLAACGGEREPAGKQDTDSSAPQAEKSESAIPGTTDAPSDADEPSVGAPGPGLDFAAMAVSKGSWFDLSGDRAAFGPPQTEASLMVSCVRNGGIELSRTGALEEDRRHDGAVVTPRGRHDGIWQPAGTELPTLTMTLPAQDPVFDEIAAASRFVVTAENLPDLVMPVDTILTDTIETCRAPAQ